MAVVSQNTLEILLKIRDEATEKLRGFASTLEKQSKKFEGYGKRMSSIGKTMMRNFTLPLTAAGGAAIKFGLDFSKAVEYANTMLKLSEDELTKFKSSILDLSDKYGKSAADIARAAYSVSSVLHTTGEETITILDAIAAGAKAGKITAEEAGNAVIRIMSIYNVQAKDTMKTVDALSATVKAGNANWQDMAEVLPNVAGLAKPLGIKLKDVAAAFAAISAKAGSSAEAGTALRGVLAGLMKPSEAMTEALQEMGYESAQAAIEAIGLKGVLSTLGEKYGDNAEKIAELFPNLRGITGAIGLFANEGRDLAESMDIVYNSVGETQKQIEKGRGTAEKFSEALNRLRNTGIRLFMVIEPYLTKFIGYIAKMTERFSKASGATKMFIVMAGGILAIAGPIIYFLGKAFIGLSKLYKVLIIAKKGLLLFRAAITLTFSHPILLLIYAVIGAFVYVYRKIKELKDIVGSWKDAWTLAMLSIRETVIKWAIKVLEVADKVTRAFGGLNRAVKDKLNNLRTELKETQQSFNDVVAASRNTQEEQEEFGDITEQVKTDIDALNKELNNLAANLPEVGEASEEAGERMEDAFQKAVDAVRSVREEIEDVVNEMASAYTSYQKDRAGEEEKFHEDVADLVAKTELEIEDLIKKRNEAFIKGNREEVNDLNAQISRKQQLLQTYYKMQLDLEDEVAERKRYYQMNELEQLAYNHQKKMLTMQKEFLAEQVERAKRLLQLLQEQAEIRKAIGETTQKAVDAELEKTKTLRDHVRERLNLVRGWKDEVVNIYDKMVEDINRTLSGIRFPLPFGGGLRGFQMGTAYVPATGAYLLHKGEAVVPAYRARKELGKNLNIVVNVNGGYYLSDDAAEELGDKIVKKLKRTIRI